MPIDWRGSTLAGAPSAARRVVTTINRPVTGSLVADCGNVTEKLICAAAGAPNASPTKARQQDNNSLPFSKNPISYPSEYLIPCPAQDRDTRTQPYILHTQPSYPLQNP